MLGAAGVDVNGGNVCGNDLGGLDGKIGVGGAELEHKARFFALGACAEHNLAVGLKEVNAL